MRRDRDVVMWAGLAVVGATAALAALIVGAKVRARLEMLEGWGRSHTDWLIELEFRTQKLEGVRS